MKASESHTHDVRGLRYHVRTWGEPRARKLFMLHGWMDVSASFQFLVDCLARDWYVIAPDWRGFGLTEWARAGYWFVDYYADLDVLLDIYQPGGQALLVGHSMGGVIGCTYAGLRAARVAKLVSLEGFGLARMGPDVALARQRRWLDELREPPQFRPYKSYAEVAARLQRNNPRLKEEQARFLAQHWARETPEGAIVLRSDPAHKRANPYPFRLEDHLACWREVRASVLWVFARDSKGSGYLSDTPAQLAERKSAFRDFHEVTLDDCGHMMHHDQPRKLAEIVENFLGA